MTNELNRVTAVLLIGFILIGIGAAFWPVVQADSLLARPDNARNVIEAQRIRRGTIYDRDGERLAYTEVLESDLVQRVYPHPVAAGAVGYYSFTYGTAGIEAAFDADLRGDKARDDWGAFVDGVLHRPQQGGDVRATVDLSIQQAAALALGQNNGAVVVVEVPSGRVLAMVSQPSYDPNSLDADWDRLVRARAGQRGRDSSPLLNRVTAGLYQPGGALQTVILAAILGAYPDLREAGGYVLNGEVPDARDPVRVNGVTLACQDGTPDGPLTLAEAYVFGCPGPFASALTGPLTPEQVWERFGTTGLLDAAALSGFETVAGPPADTLSGATPPDVLRAALVGQGDLTVTPLQMVQVVAAVANQGNAVPLHLVDAVRLPDADAWQLVPVPAAQPALLRVDVAEALRLAMLQAAAQSPVVRQARRGDLVLYGHSAQAFSGTPPTPYVWFMGFVDQTVGDQAAATAVVVVIENEDDPGAAADAAGDVFASLIAQ